MSRSTDLFGDRCWIVHKLGKNHDFNGALFTEASDQVVRWFSSEVPKQKSHHTRWPSPRPLNARFPWRILTM
jgi:hypothetical protein